MSGVEGYLADIGRNLRLGQTLEKEIIRELYAHLEDEVNELCQKGYSQEEAVKVAIERLGSAKVLARNIHEAHSGEAWGWALLAAAPHFLTALTFAFHLWNNIGWLGALLIPFAAAIGYGWRRDKPVWLYPWLGYSLLACGFIFLLVGKFISFSSPWYWLLLLLFAPLILWFAGLITIYTLRRDWLLASLMLLPFPVATAWLLTLELEGLDNYTEQSLHGVDPQIAMSFFTLGVIVAAFIRLRKRLLKSGLLPLATLIILVLVLHAKGVGFLTLAFFMSGLLLLPVLLESMVVKRKGKQIDLSNLIAETRTAK